ncbi:MAG TPA: hypothetical protein VLA13_05235 [Massilibacterium sp.]|nr:hypothetical protein [Massilibacterium sp.]
MLGTLLIIVPLIIGAGLKFYYWDIYYSDLDFLGTILLFIGLAIGLTAFGVYVNTSTYETERNAIQNSIDNARVSGNEYELATIQREVIEFNKRLDLDAKFWYPYFKLWINDDILHLEPVK